MSGDIGQYLDTVSAVTDYSMPILNCY